MLGRAVFMLRRIVLVLSRAVSRCTRVLSYCTLALLVLPRVVSCCFVLLVVQFPRLDRYVEIERVFI